MNAAYDFLLHHAAFLCDSAATCLIWPTSATFLGVGSTVPYFSAPQSLLPCFLTAAKVSYRPAIKTYVWLLFPKSQGDVLKCLVLLTNQTYLVYDEVLKKPDNISYFRSWNLSNPKKSYDWLANNYSVIYCSASILWKTWYAENRNPLNDNISLQHQWCTKLLESIFDYSSEVPLSVLTLPQIFLGHSIWFST